jgi:hypothetical protein
MSTQPPVAPPRIAVPVSDPDNEGRSLLRPGLVVLALGLLLLGVIIAGIIISRDPAGESASQVTIAELRSDTDRYDNRMVSLRGRVDNVRQLPYLDQYAIYTFQDDTGSMLVLTRKGVPSEDVRDDVRLDAVYHSRVTLDDELKSIVEDQFGPLAGQVVSMLLPGIPLNVVFLEHQRYDPSAP